MPLSEPGSHRSLKRRTAVSLLWDYGAAAAKALVQLGVLAVLSRLLTPEDFGLFAIVSVSITLASVFSTWGVSRVLVQIPDIDDEDVKTSFAITLWGGVVVGIGVVWLARPLGSFFGFAGLPPLLYAISPYFLLLALGKTAESLLQRELDFRSITIARLVSYSFGYAVTAIVMAYLGFGVWSLVGALMGEISVKSLLLVWQRRHAAALLPSPGRLGRVLRLGSSFVASRLLNTAAVEGDSLVIGKLLAADVLGVYSRAYQLMSLPANFLGATLQSVLFAAFSRAQGNRAALRRAYLDASALTLLLSSSLSALFVIVAPELVLVLLGSQWAAAVAPFRVLAFAIAFRTGYKVDDALATGTGFIDERVKRDVVYATAVVLGTAAGARFGLTGASVGVASAIALNYVLGVTMSLRIVGSNWWSYLRAQVHTSAYVALVCALALPVLILTRSLGGEAWLQLALTVVVTVAGAAAFAVAFPATLGPRNRQVLLLLMTLLPDARALAWLRGRLTPPGPDAAL